VFSLLLFWSRCGRLGGAALVREAYLVPLTDRMSSTFLEQFLVVRNTIFAIDEAVRKDLLAIVLAGGS
jgi:hypothetical protein